MVFLIDLVENFIEDLNKLDFPKIFDFVLLFVAQVREVVFQFDEFILEKFEFGFPVFEEDDHSVIFGIFLFKGLVVEEDFHAGVEIPNDVVEVFGQLFFHLLAVEGEVKS